MRNSVLIPVGVLIRIIKVIRQSLDQDDCVFYRTEDYLHELLDLDIFLTDKLHAVKNAWDYEERIKNKTP